MSEIKSSFKKHEYSFVYKPIGTEEQYRKHLFSLRAGSNGFHCPYCGHDQYCHLKSDRFTNVISAITKLLL